MPTPFSDYAARHAANSKDRTGRNVDLSRQNDKRHPDSHHQNRQVGQENVTQVFSAEISRGADDQNDCERHNRNENGYFSSVRDHDGSRASDRTRDCVASLRERTPAIFPPRITAIRSLIPRTSGSSDEIMMIAIPCSARSI